MADLDDVSQTLVGLIAGIVYPNGIGSPSVANTPAKIYQGWPLPNQLDKDLRAAVVNISVYPLPTERNVTKYPRNWQSTGLNPQTLFLETTASSVTFYGNPTSCNVMIGVNRLPYVYAVQPSDTIQKIATALANQIAQAVPGTTSSGPTINLPAKAELGFTRIGVLGNSVREIRRQERAFQITIWANTPSVRTAIAEAIDPVLAVTDFLTMPDGFAARLRYKNSPMSDNEEKQGLYRRDLIYVVQYATTQTQIDPEITAIGINLIQVPV